MGADTKIEWTDATWNPIRGCTRVSEGCRNCYAEGVARRFNGTGLAYEGLVNITTGAWNGNIHFAENHLLDPLRWKKPRRIFVNSMSDLFHENVTDEMRDRIFAVMALCPQHTFQVLTKRPERMLVYLTKRATSREWANALSRIDGDDGQGIVSEDAECYIANTINGELGDRSLGWPLKNVWLGVSVENQKAADERIPLLLQTPAVVRFLSCEPLLGPLNLNQLGKGPWPLWGPLSGYCHRHYPKHHCKCGQDQAAIDWVIAGGESGPNARPVHPDWIKGLRDQCAAAGVPFFFKQWGEWVPADRTPERNARITMPGQNRDLCAWPDGKTVDSWRTGPISERVGKKEAGHLLDGLVHHAFPEVR